MTNAVQRVERIDPAQGIQYVPGDEESAAIIRGWLGAPPTADIESVVRGIEEGDWFILNRDNVVYFITKKDFARDFRVVIEVSDD